MRQPTPMSEALTFWRESLAGKSLPVSEGFPECGFYRTRMIKGGPWVPVKVWLKQSIDPVTRELNEPETHFCLINLEPADAYARWTYFCNHPISVADYRKMVDLILWAGSNDPLNPVLYPRTPINLEQRIPGPC